jgi:hypothetical protein
LEAEIRSGRFGLGDVSGGFAEPSCRDELSFRGISLLYFLFWPSHSHHIPSPIARILFVLEEAEEGVMAASEQKHNQEQKIDRTAPAGAENSLGAESVRDGRPATDDGTVEAIDEEGPSITTPPDTGKARR